MTKDGMRLFIAVAASRTAAQLAAPDAYQIQSTPG
jgi:hypothetical protein